MKKVFTIFVLVFFCAGINTLTAQSNLKFGLNGGINLSNAYGDDAGIANNQTGFAIGGFLNIKINDGFSIRPELYYNSKGFILEQDIKGPLNDVVYDLKSESDVTMNYLEMPVLAVFTLHENVSLFAGPYFDYFISGETKNSLKGTVSGCDEYGCGSVEIDESKTVDIESDEVNNPGFGFTFGGEFLIGKFKLGARYSVGLSQIGDQDQYEKIDAKYQVLQFMVGMEI